MTIFKKFILTELRRIWFNVMYLKKKSWKYLCYRY